MKNNKNLKFLEIDGQIIEILDFNNTKTINKKLIGVIAFILILGMLMSYFVFSKVVSNNIEYKNKLGEKNSIYTKIDLKAIFEEDIMPEYLIPSSGLTKAVMNDNKIYYSYSPLNCYRETEICNNEETFINICKSSQERLCDNINQANCEENYCEETFKSHCKKDWSSDKLCTRYNRENDFDKLNVRYILSSNLDGSNIKEHEKYDSMKTVITFDYLKENDLYYYVDGNVKKLMLKNGTINEIKKTGEVISSINSSPKTIAFIEKEETNYGISFYNEETLERDESYKINSKEIRIDNETNDIYNVSILNNDIYGLYKNGELKYKFNAYEFHEIFIKNKYVYIITSDANKNMTLLKINKKNYKLIETLNNISDEYLENITYLMTDTLDNVYFYNNKSILIIEEKENKITKLIDSRNLIDTIGSYHNFIYYYDQISGNKLDRDLIIYNTITKETIIINDVSYHYINEEESRIYTIEKIENKFYLNYYEID